MKISAAISINQLSLYTYYSLCGCVFIVFCGNFVLQSRLRIVLIEMITIRYSLPRSSWFNRKDTLLRIYAKTKIRENVRRRRVQFKHRKPGRARYCIKIRSWTADENCETICRSVKLQIVMRCVMCLGKSNRQQYNIIYIYIYII